MSRETVRYPLQKALRVAADVARHCHHRFPDVFSEARSHDLNWLTGFCAKEKIRLKLKMSLPGNRKAALVRVKDTLFILVSPESSADSSSLNLAIAHELGHYVLGHLKQHNRAVALSGDTDDMWLRWLRFSQRQAEMKADFAGSFILLSNAYLEEMVEKHIFIPVNSIARDMHMDLEWVAVRVKLYRKMYGYGRSAELLKERRRNEIGVVDVGRWLSGPEQSAAGERNLIEGLPLIDAAMLSHC